jgi:UDP-glucose 4-epimerase
MALEKLKKKSQILTLNLGSGRGHSVLDMIKAFEKASSKKIHFEIVERRPGDIPASYTDTTSVEKILGWKPQYDENKICEDAWRWQQNNPFGYE